MVSVKGQITGIFSFLGHHVSVTYSGEADSVCMYRKGVLCSNKTLFTQRGGRLHVPRGGWLTPALSSMFAGWTFYRNYEKEYNVVPGEGPGPQGYSHTWVQILAMSLTSLIIC